MKLRFQRVVLTSFLLTVFFPAALRAQFAGAGASARSVSGQFIVNAGSDYSALLHDPVLATNGNYVRLEPALLAISAERFKGEFLRELGLPPNAPWVGTIILSLRPARAADETATLSLGPLVRSWAVQVQLPDVVTVPRYSRALAAALLLEYANRTSTDPGHAPEIPGWLADGLGSEIIAVDTQKIVVSAPARSVDGLTQTRTDEHERGIDPLAAARQVLQNSAALTFDELCWPDNAQANGLDGGVYAASAQLFTARLLDLPDGPALMRSFLAQLPGCLNWQTAFYEAYHEYFKRPLEVEKWWSLQVVKFAMRDPGPHWTTPVSQERLDEILAVPVEYRGSSNSLPVHTAVSLQAVILNFSPAERSGTLDLKLRDLRLAQFRLAPPFNALAAGYIAALTDYLGEGPREMRTSTGRINLNAPHPAGAAETLKKLDNLDGTRRDLEIHLNQAVPSRNLNLLPQ